MTSGPETGWRDLRNWRWKVLAVALKLALYAFLIVAANRAGGVGAAA